jgi:DNA-directed RNA polymerase subunit RPC12/RpoP
MVSDASQKRRRRRRFCEASLTALGCCMHRSPAEAEVAYEVSCACGKTLRGQRQQAHQIISCPNCGRKRFILPNSPWQIPPGTAPARPAARFNLNRLLFVIALGGALAMTLIFMLVRPYLRRPGAPGDIQALVSEGESRLRQGNVFLALNEFNAALEQRNRHSNALSREEHHRLEQLWRQTDLLSRLLDQPLEDIVMQARQHRNDDEWRAKFEYYRGRTVVFDDVLRRDAEGRPVLGSYVVRADDIEARLALEELTLLGQLPLDTPRRWLFGARLAGCGREAGGGWVVHFEPDSGVLVSDEIAAAVCCPPPLDKELLAVLKRQDEWLRR